MRITDILNEGNVSAFPSKPKFKNTGNHEIHIALDSKTGSEPKYLSQGKFEKSWGPFDIYSLKGNYYFLENGTNGWKDKDGFDGKIITPVTYVYNPVNGNVTMGSAALWARREILSSSEAFHKGNVAKMAIKNDLEKVQSIIRAHYDKYNPEGKTFNDKIAKLEKSALQKREALKKKMASIPSKKSDV